MVGMLKRVRTFGGKNSDKFKLSLYPSFVTRGYWLGVCNAIKDFRTLNL